MDCRSICRPQIGFAIGTADLFRGIGSELDHAGADEADTGDALREARRVRVSADAGCRRLVRDDRLIEGYAGVAMRSGLGAASV